jgi:hypothetical protein
MLISNCGNPNENRKKTEHMARKSRDIAQKYSLTLPLAWK